MDKAFYFPIGLIVAGLVISVGSVSRTSIDGVTSCSAIDYAKLAIGIVVALVSLGLLRKNATIAGVCLVCGIGLAGWGLNAGGILC